MISEKIKQLELIGKKAVEPDVKYWLGKAIPLKTLRGKVVMLDFWAPWCGPCREAFPGLKKLYEQFHHRGFEIISLTNYYPFYRDDREVVKEASAEVYDKKLKEFIKRFALPWSILMAENNSNREKYSVSFIPTFFLIDKSGIIRYAQVGTRKDKNHLKRKIESLLK
jgi:thiol-disulfide isomerase/thioredoxin